MQCFKVAFRSEAVNLLVTRRVSEDPPAASLTRRVTILPQMQPARIDSQSLRESTSRRNFRGAKRDSYFPHDPNIISFRP